jgi:hypothetical protein
MDIVEIFTLIRVFSESDLGVDIHLNFIRDGAIGDIVHFLDLTSNCSRHNVSASTTG